MMLNSKWLSVFIAFAVMVTVFQSLPKSGTLVAQISQTPDKQLIKVKPPSISKVLPEKPKAQIPEKKLHLPSKPVFSEIKDTRLKKKTFFEFMYENVKIANAKVLQQRKQIITLEQQWQQQKPFSKQQQQQLAHFQEKYRIDEKLNLQEQFKQLLIKVDAVPPSLVLAQSANESAWGTSRFARLGNNFFGQWCYRKGCGIVPTRRNAGSTHEVASFNSVLKSVDEYLYNINVSRSYKLIRKIRAEQRQKGEIISGFKLAEGLIRYSERREAYVKEIQSMIRFNKLAHYDGL